jgi:hypothetical protein
MDCSIDFVWSLPCNKREDMLQVAVSSILRRAVIGDDPITLCGFAMFSDDAIDFFCSFLFPVCENVLHFAIASILLIITATRYSTVKQCIFDVKWNSSGHSPFVYVKNGFNLHQRPFYSSWHAYNVRSINLFPSDKSIFNQCAMKFVWPFSLCLCKIRLHFASSSIPFTMYVEWLEYTSSRRATSKVQ